LQAFGLEVQIHDPHVTNQQLKGKNINLKSWDDLKKADVVMLTVPHQVFQTKSTREWQTLCKEDKGIVMDLKNILPEDTFSNNITKWSM